MFRFISIAIVFLVGCPALFAQANAPGAPGLDAHWPSAAKKRLGEGTGSATPLAWSMAQFIRLTANLKSGQNNETPRIFADRYIHGGKNGRYK